MDEPQALQSLSDVGEQLCLEKGSQKEGKAPAPQVLYVWAHQRQKGSCAEGQHLLQMGSKHSAETS